MVIVMQGTKTCKGKSALPQLHICVHCSGASDLVADSGERQSGDPNPKETHPLLYKQAQRKKGVQTRLLFAGQMRGCQPSA
jgi:hypothetical protein